MVSRFRQSIYTVSALVLFVCLTSVSVRAQENGDTSRERTAAKPLAESNLKAAGSTPGSAERARADRVADKVKVADKLMDAVRGEDGSPDTARVSYLLPNLTPPTTRTAPDAPAGGTPTSSPPQGSSGKWEFTVAPYLWLAGISGTVGVRGLTTDVDASFSDILNTLNFGFMGVFEARKNKFFLATDLMYLSIGETKTTTGPLFSSLKVDQKTFMLSPVAGYRLIAKEGASLDAIAGIRFWHTSTRLEAAPKLLAGRVEESSKNWTDVIVGLRGQAHVSRIFSVMGRADVGGGGSDYTYQLFGGVGIDVSKKATLIAGYRDLFIKYTRGDFLFDGSIRGALLGVAFRF